MPVRKSVRLPKHIQPVRYRLMLRPDLEQFTFYGEETAYLEITKSTKEIVFHAKDLKVLSAELTQDDQIIPAKIKHNSKVETVTFLFSKTIKKGSVELKLVFEGELNDNLRGFYRSKYFHLDQEKYLATTQFESTDARRAFPCIDEPSAKAIFDVTLMIPKGMTAISNTVSTNIAEHDSGYQIVEFAPTPKMSTYLLAFLVGDFEFIEGKTEEGVVVRIFTTPGKKKQAEFALDVACKMITFYNRYFDIPYPLPVMDMIAVPDFAAGAMENWGAVTYRETALLIDPKNSSAANRQRVAIVIAHELAHMWFGDLVTMEWWTHLWLNEGFASYIEYLATDHVFPEWDIWTQFVYADQSVALKLDGLKNTHPIEVEVNHPSEISEIFDKVSYSKGASIIRMLADYLGPEVFRDGLRYYLKKHQYSNARTEDLWAAFAKISGKPVAKIMKNWTALPGYPLIRIEEKNKKLVLKQHRFFSNPASQTTKKSLWSVPVSITSSTDQTKRLLLKTPKAELPIPAGEWFKVNPNEYGFYRVLYTPEQLQNLNQAINDQQLGPIDRFGIVRDSFDLSEAGFVQTVEALKLAQSYINETDFTVWAELTVHLSQLDDLYYGQDFYPQYQNFARQIYSRIAPLMGWTKKPRESHTDSLLRNLALYKFGAYGDKETIKQAQNLFKDFVDNDKPVDADIRGAVYNLVALNGGNKEYKIFKQKYISETLQQERDRLARAMTLFDDPKLIQQTLEFAISKDVRAQDAIFIIKAIFMNPAGKDLAWQFIKDNWILFKERYGGGLMMLPRLLESLEIFNTKQSLSDIQKFFAKNSAPEAARTLAQAIEQINSNISWLKRDAKQVAKFLQTK